MILVLSLTLSLQLPEIAFDTETERRGTKDRDERTAKTLRGGQASLADALVSTARIPRPVASDMWFQLALTLTRFLCRYSAQPSPRRRPPSATTTKLSGLPRTHTRTHTLVVCHHFLKMCCLYQKNADYGPRHAACTVIYTHTQCFFLSF